MSTFILHSQFHHLNFGFRNLSAYAIHQVTNWSINDHNIHDLTNCIHPKIVINITYDISNQKTLECLNALTQTSRCCAASALNPTVAAAKPINPPYLHKQISSKIITKIPLTN